MFKPQERLIYKYHDGEKEIAVDPLKIYRRLIAKPTFQTDATLVDAFMPRLAKNELEPKQAEDFSAALDRLLANVREAFAVKEFSQEEGKDVGLLDNELFLLLQDFLQFLEGLTAKGPNPQTWQAPTAQVSSETLTTPRTAGSTSTAPVLL